MKTAGFDSIGLELTPWVADFGSKTFGIEVVNGPLGEQSVGQESYDIVAMFDVLEHLSDPLKTMRACVGLIKKDGILVIQTPKYPAGRTYSYLVRTKDPFPKPLKSERLYLFSAESLKKLCNLLGLNELQFRHPLFPYDMFPVASRLPTPINNPEVISEKLRGSPSGRLILALLDLDNKFRGFKSGTIETRIKNSPQWVRDKWRRVIGGVREKQ